MVSCLLIEMPVCRVGGCFWLLQIYLLWEQGRGLESVETGCYYIEVHGATKPLVGQASCQNDTIPG